MRLKLHAPAQGLRQWHVTLAERLAALPRVSVEVEPVPGAPLPPEADLLFSFEQLLYGLPGPRLSRPIAASKLASFSAAGETADIVLDLCGSSAAEGERLWCLTYDGVAGEGALLGLLLDGGTPCAAVQDGNAILGSARLGSENGGIAVASFEDALARTITFVVAVMTGCGTPDLPRLPAEAERPRPTTPSRRRLAEAAAKQVARRVMRQLYAICCHAPHWKVGWRRLNGPDMFDLRRLPDAAWHVLPEDGSRFYADPFPIEHQGRVTLFVEEYVHRLGKGIISALAYGADGPLGSPRPVLEEAYHLSYPFIFTHDGAIWMVPESCAAGRVDLYRATRFPDGWVKEATLLADVAASDATLIEYGGKWWLFATVRDGGGAYSDALYLWSAPDFRGPFTPHRRNPVLIDIASARPAGRMVMRDGALLRPVQDCRKGYGAALAIARVARLDDDGFEQTVETVIGPGPTWPGRRLHTLNAAGGLEFIDGSAFASRWLRT